MIVKKVEIKGDKVKVILDKDKSFEITLETYLNNEILLESELDESRITFLTGQDSFNHVKNLLLKKISKKRLSKKECLNFLLENGLNIEDSKKIIKSFESNYLINDLELSEMVIYSCLANKKGINNIKEKLHARLVEVDYDKVIDKFLDMEKYEENIHYQLDKYFKLGHKKSKNEIKHYLSAKMIENGFLKEEFVRFLDKYEVDEYSSINTEIIKFFKNREVNKENIAKITKKLLSKGFNYAIIKDVIRECVSNEIN